MQLIFDTFILQFIMRITISPVSIILLYFPEKVKSRGEGTQGSVKVARAGG
jgi:hypothetical protein